MLSPTKKALGISMHGVFLCLLFPVNTAPGLL